MGGTVSSFGKGNDVSKVFATPRVKNAFEKIIGEKHIPREDAAYQTLFSVQRTFNLLTLKQIECLTKVYGDQIALNNTTSGNFCLLVRYLIHTLPLSCRVERMSTEEFQAHLLHSNSQADAKKKTVQEYLDQSLNALFLTRHLLKCFMKKETKMMPLLQHFQDLFSSMISPTTETTTRSAPSSSSSKRNPLPRPSRTTITSPASSSGIKVSQPEDLAFRFLEVLVIIIMDFSPTQRTYDLYVEVLNTLLVLLSPTMSCCSSTTTDQQQSNDQVQNLFMTFFFQNAMVQGKKSFWAHTLIQQLLDNVTHPFKSELIVSKESLVLKTCQENEASLSLDKIQENIADHTKAEAEQFSYLTLEGIGTIASSSLLRFPMSMVKFLVSSDEHAHRCPIAERSVLLLLVLTQTQRFLTLSVEKIIIYNPFRLVLAQVTNKDESSTSTTANSTNSLSSPNSVATSPSAFTNNGSPRVSVSYTKLYEQMACFASFQAYHLFLYTFLYTNRFFLQDSLTTCDTKNSLQEMLLALLKALYQAKSVHPQRLYFLLIVLLTWTQDATFVGTAHSKIVYKEVSWYTEKLMFDISLGSLMMLVLIRLIHRNIVHFQDLFVHQNAFGALWNLSLKAQGLHMYTTESLIGLIDVLTRKEAQLKQKKKQTIQEHDMNKQLAYIELMEFTLGILSNCLHPLLAPRNPQLIYSLLYRASTFDRLMKHEALKDTQDLERIQQVLQKYRQLLEKKQESKEEEEQAVVLDVATVFTLIQKECVSQLATQAATIVNKSSIQQEDQDGVYYGFEEEIKDNNPERVFTTLVWEIVKEATKDLNW